ncbi:MAG TPA: hypothetical protein DIT07_11815, partial [Sphingobacteriaceae bacterium]|nr:hypothetical protein [Sphingobacteriaceae bacterium]
FQDISSETVDSTLARAEKKLEAWKSKGFKERTIQLNHIINDVLEEKDQLSTFITLEMGKFLAYV